MRRRRINAKRRSRSTAQDWEEGWDLAMARIDGVPALVEGQPFFQECLAVLNGAFADGDRLRFELGLSAMIDLCSETVNKGDCKQWWD
jgi:hypothetical protein